MSEPIRVLLVDDESALLEVSALFLESSGDITVKTVLGAPEAMQLLERERFDVIVSDYQMPVMDGIEFLTEVRRHFGQIPFILFTGRGREEIVILAIDRGADSYVQKGGETKSQFAELAHKIRMAVKRRVAESQTAESKEFLKNVIADAKEGIIVYDRDLRIMLWNRFMEDLTGLPAAEVLGKNTLELFPFHTENGNDILMKQALTGITTETQDFAFVIPSTGKRGWVKSVFSPNYDLSGAIKGVIGIVRDVTERKQAEVALQESEERYRKIFENSPLGMILLTPDLRFFRVNPALAAMTGYSEEELPGMSFADITHPDHLTSDRQSLEDLTAGKIPAYTTEKRYIRKDGSVMWGSVRVTSILDDHAALKYYAAQIEDITERRLTAEALRTTNKKLNLLSGITRHDIANQLLVMSAYVSLLNDQQPDPAAGEYLGKMDRSLTRMNDMIGFSREYEKVGVAAPVWQNCHSLVDIAAKQILMGDTIVKNDLPPHCEVFADPLIFRVFCNLIDNAMRHGKTITTLRFSVADRAGSRVIVCEDDGVGVPAEEKEVIFEQGFGKNTGMGLFLSREILDITGITIKETGEPGRGARFEIILPPGAFRAATIPHAV
ncbi:multi-sensor signal transduction histidine kinase [Methanoregula boonei 6A8]|uniref:histidine kinase n=1 Tax=Methanoregula boonei (strain DSM 21154 / JCM 14090 / 6A8) TaxID=456442 RepID=A7I541_METB6|nr:PAS domain S-box protein [Methanoregula boonei]ABS54852.1 multi-sensor signal transduction histidine kinase [Methanoregula boonei 6A8]